MRIHITEAIQDQSVYGTPTELEIDFAKKLRDAIPSLERSVLLIQVQKLL